MNAPEALILIASFAFIFATLFLFHLVSKYFENQRQKRLNKTLNTLKTKE